MIEKIRIETDKLDDKINALVEKVETADMALMKHINNKVAELDAQKQELSQRLSELENTQPVFSAERITDCMSVWDVMSFDDKRAIVKILIKRISIDSDGYSIEWNI